MIKKSLLVISSVAVMTTAAQATAVLLTSARSSPTVVNSDASTAANGTVRLGRITDTAGITQNSTIAEINAVFVEFGTGITNAAGRPSADTSIGVEADAVPFNGQQIYMWVLNADSSEQGLYTHTGTPSNGSDPWVFKAFDPPFDGSTISAAALAADAGAVGGTALIGALEPGTITLAPVIPEPSGAVLAGLAGAMLLFRRRR